MSVRFLLPNTSGFVGSKLTNQVIVGTVGGGGQPEITLLEINRALAEGDHGAYCTLAGASAAKLGIYFDLGARQETTQCTVPAGFTCNTNAGGLYIELQRTASDRRCYWMNTGAETQPSVSGVTFVEISIANDDSAASIGDALANAATADGFSCTNDSAGTITLTSTDAGAWTNAGGTLGSISVTIEGRDAATPPSGDGINATRQISGTVGTSKEDLAALVAAAIDDWAKHSTSFVGAVITITDNANGTREDAATFTDLLSVTVTQQGT